MPNYIFRGNRVRTVKVTSERGGTYFLKDFTNGNDADRIISSMFLICKTLNPVDSASPTYFLTLKPQCLWLDKTIGGVTDINGKTGTDIADYIAYGSESRITTELLENIITTSSLIDPTWGIPTEATFKNLATNFPSIYIQDKNEANRNRIAAPNTQGQGSTYIAFSRWM